MINKQNKEDNQLPLSNKKQCNTSNAHNLDILFAYFSINDLYNDDNISIDKESKSKLKEFPTTESILSVINKKSKIIHRRWGQYQIIKQGQKHNKKIKVKILKILKNYNISYQYHQYRNEKWLCLEGKGYVVIDGNKREISPGDIITIKNNQLHSIQALEDIFILEIQYGEKTLERDIVRITKDWSQILKKK